MIQWPARTLFWKSAAAASAVHMAATAEKERLPHTLETMKAPSTAPDSAEAEPAAAQKVAVVVDHTAMARTARQVPQEEALQLIQAAAAQAAETDRLPEAQADLAIASWYG
jgi:hypothetical protein